MRKTMSRSLAGVDCWQERWCSRPASPSTSISRRPRPRKRREGVRREGDWRRRRAGRRAQARGSIRRAWQAPARRPAVAVHHRAPTRRAPTSPSRRRRSRPSRTAWPRASKARWHRISTAARSASPRTALIVVRDAEQARAQGSGRREPGGRRRQSRPQGGLSRGRRRQWPSGMGRPDPRDVRQAVGRQRPRGLVVPGRRRPGSRSKPSRAETRRRARICDNPRLFHLVAPPCPDPAPRLHREFEITIDDMTHDGRGVGRRRGQGRVRRWRLARRDACWPNRPAQPSFRRSRDARGAAASPDRVDAALPAFRHLRRLRAAAPGAKPKQIEAKQRVLLENLERIGHVEPAARAAAADGRPPGAIDARAASRCAASTRRADRWSVSARPIRASSPTWRAATP